MFLAKASCYFCSLYNLKSASSSFELPINVGSLPKCLQIHTQTDTQYDYYTLPPTLRAAKVINGVLTLKKPKLTITGN